MSYPQHLLTEGEEIVTGFRPHWKSLIIPVLWTVLFVVGIVAANELIPDRNTPRYLVYAVLLIGWVVMAVWPTLSWWFTTFVLTNERLIARAGIVARRGVEIPLEVINDVHFKQTIFERMLGFGDLVIESAGEQGQSRFSNIPKPEIFQSEVYRAREARARDLSSPQDPTDTLATLARLHAEGVLTDEEFEAKKAKLLGEI